LSILFLREYVCVRIFIKFNMIYINKIYSFSIYIYIYIYIYICVYMYYILIKIYLSLYIFLKNKKSKYILFFSLNLTLLSYILFTNFLHFHFLSSFSTSFSLLIFNSVLLTSFVFLEKTNKCCCYSRI